MGNLGRRRFHGIAGDTDIREDARQLVGKPVERSRNLCNLIVTVHG